MSIGVEMISRSPRWICCSSPSPDDVGQHVGRVRTAEDRVEEDPVVLPVDQPGCLEVALIAGPKRIDGVRLR